VKSSRPKSSSAQLELRLRLGGIDYPPFSPVTPPDGWTPQAVLDEAVRYANENSLSDLGYRRLVGVCYAGLMAQLPRVKRREIEDRLYRHVEILHDHLNGPRPAVGEPDDEDEPLPF
jgi:hypothetical protein